MSRGAIWRPQRSRSVRSLARRLRQPAGNRSRGGQAGASQNGDVYVPPPASDYDAQVTRRREAFGASLVGVVRCPVRYGWKGGRR
ncbi:hypothetical protein MRX96_024750 [Rhipicephalus microplus]